MPPAKTPCYAAGVSILPIRKMPDPVLTRKTRPVELFDAALDKLINDMVETMRAAPGVGLAANQVGIGLSVAVVEDIDNEDVLVLINPKITRQSPPIQVESEGCLSIPGYWGQPERSESVRVTAQDRQGDTQRVRATGFLAQVLQHEIDHLNGLAFPDRFPEGVTLHKVEEAPESSPEA